MQRNQQLQQLLQKEMVQLQARNPNNAQGIDVSHHQGIIDWVKAKASGKVDFAFVKASEGLGYVDPQFKRNAAETNALNIPVGYYHYAHPETNKALDEAAAFVQATKGQPSQLPYVLDLEGEASKLSAIDLTAWALTFMREVKRLTGASVMLYTGAYFARDEVGTALGEFPLWVAHYGATTPLANGTWDKWTIFQYSSSGAVPGIVGNVDMNEYNGSMSELMGYQMKSTDANKVIEFLKAAYGVTPDHEAQTEIKRLANELRKASGQPIQ
jgi:lysozyme